MQKSGELIPHRLSAERGAKPNMKELEATAE
jgi:hypothetical protein